MEKKEAIPDHFVSPNRYMKQQIQKLKNLIESCQKFLTILTQTEKDLEGELFQKLSQLVGENITDEKITRTQEYTQKILDQLKEDLKECEEALEDKKPLKIQFYTRNVEKLFSKLRAQEKGFNLIVHEGEEGKLSAGKKALY